MSEQLTKEQLESLTRERSKLAIQRIVFDLGRSDEHARLTDEQRQLLTTEVEGARMNDQHIADKIRDEPGKPNDDYFPTLGMKPVGDGVQQIITFQRVERGHKFALEGAVDENTWSSIRQWMNQFIGAARSVWAQWAEKNSAVQDNIAFDSKSSALFFQPESEFGIGFRVQTIE